MWDTSVGRIPWGVYMSASACASVGGVVLSPGFEDGLADRGLIEKLMRRAACKEIGSVQEGSRREILSQGGSGGVEWRCQLGWVVVKGWISLREVKWDQVWIALKAFWLFAGALVVCWLGVVGERGDAHLLRIWECFGRLLGACRGGSGLGIRGISL